MIIFYLRTLKYSKDSLQYVLILLDNADVIGYPISVTLMLLNRVDCSQTHTHYRVD